MSNYGLWRNPLNAPIDPQPQRPRAQELPDPPYGKPDFHFLYLAPGLDVAYFFEAAQLYWETFKAIVVNDLELLRYVPRQYSVAITSLARTDSAPAVRSDIENSFGARVYHDPLVYDFLEDMQITLEARALRNEPFGVPLTEASAE